LLPAQGTGNRTRSKRRRSTPRPTFSFTPAAGSEALAAIHSNMNLAMSGSDSENSTPTPSPEASIPSPVSKTNRRSASFETATLQAELGRKEPDIINGHLAAKPSGHRRRHSDDSASELTAAIQEARSRRSVMQLEKGISVAELPVEVETVEERSAVDMCLRNRSILEIIVGHLEVPDMPLICRVCKTWNTLMETRELWLRLYISYEIRVKSTVAFFFFFWKSNPSRCNSPASFHFRKK